jgi:hypothetical protein
MNKITMKDICECDVRDKESLSLFRSLICKWQEVLAGEDRHSIFNQIKDLVWDDTVYRTFNEARQISIENRENGNQLPGTIIELIDKTFIVNQIMAIRRLSDQHAWSPERSVYSIPNLIKEIEQHLDFFTRENYLCYTGRPFCGNTLTYPEDMEHRGLNRDFDFLSGTKDDKRSRNDLLQEKIIEHMKEYIRETKTLRDYANKFFAHPVAPDNRRKIESKLKEITLNYIDSCYKSLIKVGKYLELIIQKVLVTEVATPQFDQLQYWEMPMINVDLKTQLYDFWNIRVEKIYTWSRIDGERLEEKS